MELMPIIRRLEQQSNQQRLQFIQNYLTNQQIPYELQMYATGTNLFIKPQKTNFIGISSHFDVVPHSGGANDNASAIAVCLGILLLQMQNPLKNVGLQFFFFDEEECGLKGSRAYIEKYGIVGMQGLINLEMVGMGNQFALWELNENSQGKIFETLEKEASRNKTMVRRLDQIVTNYADHVSFRETGLTDSFSMTCISEKDIEVAYYFYQAQAEGVSMERLHQIIAQAPIFEHYHQPSDLSIYLNENSLQMTLNLIWQTLLAMDREQ